MEHICKPMNKLCEKKESMDISIGAGGVPDHGPSIRYVEYLANLDIWVAHCDEYATIIEYCPFCGIYLRSLL